MITESRTTARPVVGIPACRKMIDPHWFHAVGEKYITAAARGAGALVVLVPVLGEELDVEALLERLDGLLLTGSPSNVEPRHYRGPASDPDLVHDPARDATNLRLIPAAISCGVPLLGICRGAQEMNVAHGGMLHQKVHEVEGLADHREDKSQPLEAQYAPAHEVTLTPGGRLERLAGSARLEVNSVHGQGIATLGHGLAVEAVAPDGLIEGFHVVDAPAFALAVQWHPEWKFQDDPFSVRLFAAFGEACRERARRKQRQ